MWIPLALSLSLWRARVCFFVNIASKVVTSFDLRRVPGVPTGGAQERQKRQRRGMTVTVAERQGLVHGVVVSPAW